VIFGPGSNINPVIGLPSPHRYWFKEAIENYWWKWSLPDAPTGEAPYKLRGPYWPFDRFVGPFSGINAIDARAQVEAGSFNSVELVPDQHGVTAFITLIPVDDKPLFCEMAVVMTLRIALFVYLEDTRPGARDIGPPVGGVPVRIQALCEMFGQPPTMEAWQTGPPERQVRIAVIELLKELGADPALIKHPNRSALKLQTSLPSMRTGRPWVPTGRAKPMEDFGSREIGYPPEDHPLFPVEQPHLHGDDGLYYDTIPADVRSVSGVGTPSGLFFDEVVPPEWPEFLDEFATHYSDTPGRVGWPTISTLTSSPPIPPHGPIEYRRLINSTEPGGGQTRRLVYEGGFGGEGDWSFGTIPWADGHGYTVGVTPNGSNPWGEVDDHIVLEYDPAFPLAPPIPRPVSGYTLDWYSIEITVYDATGEPVYVGGGLKGQDAGEGTGAVIGLTNTWVRGIGAVEIEMFDADRLPLSSVAVKVTSETIKVFDEDQLWLTPGAGGGFVMDHYVFPDDLIPAPPPWPGSVRVPGNIAVGPGFRGSHPTVKGLRGGRVSGAHRQWPI
jgi:hypothetical protein